EQGTHNPLVLGSNPGGPTTETSATALNRRGGFFFFWGTHFPKALDRKITRFSFLPSVRPF
ncbi:hypothetical protein, partial [Slackia piriformis]|uniref:hypothetical protein n=1 Tax=Slackia piriformis TaxID=626934 RepID=UPI0026DBA6E1